MDYDVLTFIGRFQPFHNGHKAVVDAALKRAKKVAIVIGSDQQPRSARNPFTTKERIEMISSVYPEEVTQNRIQFCPQVDHTYNMDRWIGGIQSSAMAVSQTPFNPDPVNMGLIGHSKDASSFYLKSFPTWDSVEVDNVDGVSATDIRNAFFANDLLSVEHLMPQKVRAFLYRWRDMPNPEAVGPQDDTIWTPEYKAVRAEQNFLVDYKKQFIRPTDAQIEQWLWETQPSLDDAQLVKDFADKFCPKYPPVFYTADAVVVQSGHVLLVKRGAMPGKDLWALPGGFVNEHEMTRPAAIRELREETRLAVPGPVLDGSIRMWRVFDDPYRSQRGRTITTAYKFELAPMSTGLPKVKGSDDAAKAQWVPLSQLRREAMFEDHYDIIETMVGI